jgi:hypothetical protein
MFEYPGASYIWKKGTATLSNTRDYFIANYDSSYNGTYTGTMTINGCITRSVTVTINSSLCSTPLPLSLLDFTAVVAGNNVNLAWTTTDERNVSNFEIERSPDATNWTRISRVNAKGMSKNLNTYFYQDSKPFTGVNFYRLKVIDIDKTFKMSPVRVVRLDQDFELQLFPNPTQTSAKLILQKPASQGSELILYDDFGRLLSRQSVANQQVIIVNTENYHPGIYFIMISNNGNIIYKGKLIKI